MSIQSEITKIQQAKSNIRQAITQKGGIISNETPFSDYASIIDDLPTGGEKVLTSIDISDFDDTTFSPALYYTEEAIIPSGFVSIANNAFYNCTRLKSVTIPNSVTVISQNAFSGCSGLTSVTIPSGVTEIYNAAFQNCASLTSVTLPNGLTGIANQTFSGCTSLTSVTIPTSVNAINNYAFQNCTSLTAINIPNNVASFGQGAFSGCSGLTSVTIPSGVTSIGNSVFSGCTSLTSVTVNATTPPVLGGTTVFSNTNDCPIYVPTGTLSAYESASDWSRYADRIFEYGVAKWVEQSYECELDGEGHKTGYKIATELDTNPSSSTYNTTRTVTVEATDVCSEPVSGAFNKIVTLGDAGDGKYLLVWNTGTVIDDETGETLGYALNTPLIKDTTSTSTGINTSTNYMPVGITGTTIDGIYLNYALDYDSTNKKFTWTDSGTGTVYYITEKGSNAQFEYNQTTASTKQTSIAEPVEGHFTIAVGTKYVGLNGQYLRWYATNATYHGSMEMYKYKE